jgi:hypothetical protein
MAGAWKSQTQKHCKTACRFEIDIGRGTTESTVVFISTLKKYGLKTGSFLMSGIGLSPLILRPKIGASYQLWVAHKCGAESQTTVKKKKSCPLPLRPP